MDNTLVIIFIVASLIGVVIATLFITWLLKSTSGNKYSKVINPTNIPENVSKNEIKEMKAKKSFLGKLEDSEFNKTIKQWYVYAGKEGKDINDFLKTNLLFFGLALALGAVLYLTFSNLIISLTVPVVVLFLPTLDLASTIMERKTAFRNQFPYFLQTLSFVLSNGGTLNTSFAEVVEKTRDGVLKDVMKEVIVVSKTNGGDFGGAFSIISDKINIDETKEFSEIIQNNLEKGIPVAETFMNQSNTISRFVALKKQKKVRNMSNTIMVPIIILLGAIALLFI